MSYDDTSFNGDLLCDEYDEQNNFMNPQSPFGFLVYHLLGDGFDLMADMCTQFMNDFNILTADTRGLDKFWGISYNMPRPYLEVESRYLTDDEYKVYLYLRNGQLITREDIEVNMNKCFAIDDYGVYFTRETQYLSATDHLLYTPTVTDTSDLSKNSDDTTNDYLVELGSEDTNVHLLAGNLSEGSEVYEVINIPANDWDTNFLDFLSKWISVKGNLKIKEYEL